MQQYKDMYGFRAAHFCRVDVTQDDEVEGQRELSNTRRIPMLATVQTFRLVRFFVYTDDRPDLCMLTAALGSPSCACVFGRDLCVKETRVRTFFIHPFVYHLFCQASKNADTFARSSQLDLSFLQRQNNRTRQRFTEFPRETPPPAVRCLTVGSAVSVRLSTTRDQTAQKRVFSCGDFFCSVFR